MAILIFLTCFSWHSMSCDGFAAKGLLALKSHGYPIIGIPNYKKFKLDTCNWTPMRLRANYMYVKNRLMENQS